MLDLHSHMNKLKTFAWVFLLLLVSIWVSKLNGQAFEWAQQTGGNQMDISTGLAQDSEENVYLTGNFEGEVDFDPGMNVHQLDAEGEMDVFIQKLDSNGSLLWAHRIGAQGRDESNSIHIDQDDNIFISGYFNDTVDFDPGMDVFELIAVGAWDMFLLKLDSDGNFLWAISVGGDASGVEGNSIDTDTLGNVYIAGQFSGVKIDFDPGLDSFNIGADRDLFVLKLDEEGRFQWVETIGIGGYAVATSIATDNAGNSYITGDFWGDLDFDPGPNMYNLFADGSESYLLKLDSSGDFIWAKSYNTEVYWAGNSVHIDTNGDVLFCAAQFLANNEFGISIEKTTPDGSKIWSRAFETAGITSGFMGLDTDSQGNIYASSNFFQKTDFDPGPDEFFIDASKFSVFLIKLNSSGDFSWAKGFETNEINKAFITVTEENSFYISSSFSWQADLNPGLGQDHFTSSGGTDVCLIKFEECTLRTGTDEQNSCRPFTWIDGQTYLESNNTATHLLPCGSMQGCDSLVQLVLTITGINTEVDVNGLSMHSNQENADYQWLDCDNQYNPIMGEIFQTFTAPSSGSYAAEITYQGCVDTTDCIELISTSVTNLPALSITCFPNPSLESLQIFLEGSRQNISVMLIDPVGKRLLEKHCDDCNQFNLDVNHLSGVFLLQVFQDNQHLHSEKVIIQPK